MRRDLMAELVGVGLGIAGLVLFAAIVEEVERFQEPEELTDLDLVVAEWAAAHVTGPLFVAGLVLARLGSVVVVGLLILVAAVFSWSRGRRLQAAAVALGALFLQLMVAVSKWFFGRARPDVGLVVESGHSFPSGHAAFGGYLAVVLIWFAIHHVRRRSRTVSLLSVAAVWALLQAIGRVLIVVHYVSDVLAGLGLGVAVGGFGLALAPLAGRIARWMKAVRPWSHLR